MQQGSCSEELWGEWNRSGATLQLSQQEREALSWLPKPLQLEGPRIHQPLGGHKSSGPTFASPKETQIQDEWVLGGIRLLNFKTDLEAIHENLVIKKERSGTAFMSSGSPTLDIPQLPPPIQGKSNSTSKRGLFASNVDEDGDASDVGVKEEDVKWHQQKTEENFHHLESPPLSATVVRQLMHKSVAAISAFYGYEQSTDEALNVLTDVACDFTRQFCQMLRLSRDNQLLGNSTGFADVMERTYRDMNLGSILDLRDFYSNFVVGRYKAIRKECKGLVEKCQNLEDGATLNVGVSGAFTPNVGSVENGSVDNIPEIHFPSSEEGDTIVTFSLDHHTPQMETGLQMLQSLEQGNYGSLAGGVASSVDDDLHHHQPVSHESTSGILLRTPSPSRKRRKT